VANQFRSQGNEKSLGQLVSEISETARLVRAEITGRAQKIAIGLALAGVEELKTGDCMWAASVDCGCAKAAGFSRRAAICQVGRSPSQDQRHRCCRCRYQWQAAPR